MFISCFFPACDVSNSWPHGFCLFRVYMRCFKISRLLADAYLALELVLFPKGFCSSLRTRWLFAYTGRTKKITKKLLKSERLNTFNLLTHLRTLHFHDRGRILLKNLAPQKKYITLCRFVSWIELLLFLRAIVQETCEKILSACLPKILITQIGHKIDFLQILYVNYTLSRYFKNTFRLGSKCFLRQFTKGVPWWTKMDILLVQKCQFSITLVTPHNT